MEVMRVAIRVGVRGGFGSCKSVYLITGKNKINSVDLNTRYSNHRMDYIRGLPLPAHEHERILRKIATSLFRPWLAYIIALGCNAAWCPQSFGAIDHITGFYDNTSVVFTLYLTEPSLAADGWTAQLFINSDNLISTGYANGIEFVAATDDYMENNYIHVRGTATSDGPDGWGSSLAAALLTLPDTMTVVMEIPLSPDTLPSGYVRFGFELYLNGRIVDVVSNTQTSLDPDSIECTFDNQCVDNLFCTGIETCFNGLCQSTGDPCPGQRCDDVLNRCIECLTDTDCNDGLFCNGNEFCDANFNCQLGSPPNCNSDNISCTTNDYCDEALDLCNGIPDDSLCGSMFACLPFLGCKAIDSEVPIVTASGSRFISIDLQPRNSIIPVSIFVTSPNWPCLGKYVGPPVAADFDDDNTLDGTMATLVDNPLDAARLTPGEWTGKACNNIGPTCRVDSDCNPAETCQPIMRCDQSLLPCDTIGDCPVGESCINAKLHITGYDIIPSSLDNLTRDVIPISYSVMIDSGGYLFEPVSVDMQVFGDIDMNTVVNAADLGLVIRAFQGMYHLPVRYPVNSVLPAVDQAGASICSTSLPVIVTANDILMTIKSFQLYSFTNLAALSGCPLPCP